MCSTVDAKSKTHFDLLFLKKKGSEGPGDSLTAAGEITEGLKGRKNYNIALRLCRTHPGRECFQAI
jgi:hypothetical protein